MMLRKHLLVAALLACSGPVFAVDLLTVYQQAVATNPQLAAVEANLRAVRESRPQAKAGLLPILGADGSVDINRRKNIEPSENARHSTDKQAAISLTQPLFRYDRWILLNQTDSAIAAAEAQYAAAHQELMVRVAERYFSVLAAQDNLQFAESEKAAIGRQLDQATQRFEVGLIAITDVKAAQARYDLSRSREIQAISDLAAARDALRETVGVYYEDLHRLKSDLELVRPEPDSAAAWIEKAEQQNLGVLAARANTEQALQEIRRQRAGHLPTLDLNASTGYIDANFGGIAPIERQDSQIGLQLNIPIYQGGSINSQTREARSRFEETTQQLQQEIRAAELETRNAFRGISTDIAQVEALGASLVSTEVAMEAEQAGFEVGTRTIVDVLNAQSEFYLARLNYARARYLYVVDQLRLKRAAGILDTADLIAVNETLIRE